MMQLHYDFYDDDDSLIRNPPDLSINGFGDVASCVGLDGTGFLAEYDDDDMIGDTGYVRMKNFHLAPEDFGYVEYYGEPYDGMQALADDGDVYEYQSTEMGSLWKKILKKNPKFQRIVGKITRMTPGGRAAWWTHTKIAKPVMKKLEPYSKQLAPIAKMIPFFGPYIAAALEINGTVYEIKQKTGVKFTKKGKPIFKNKSQKDEFQYLLNVAASKMSNKKAKKIVRGAQQGAEIYSAYQKAYQRNQKSKNMSGWQ